jgi:hypothetical protein
MLIVVIDLSSIFDSIVVSMYNLLFMFMIYFWIKIKLKVLLFSTNSYQTKDKWIYENDDAGLLMEFLWSVMALDGGLTLRSLQSIVMSPDIVEVVVLGASLRFIGLGAYADDKGAMCFWEECCLGCGVWANDNGLMHTKATRAGCGGIFRQLCLLFRATLD